MKRRGFTLVEILLVVMLVAVPLLALVGTQIFITRASGKNQSRHLACVIASSLVEEAERELWDFFDTPLAKARQPVPGYPGYEFEMLEEEETPVLRKVEAVVYWSDNQGEHEYHLKSKLYAQ